LRLATLPEIETDAAVREARTDDVSRLAAIATSCFSQYRLNINRFNTEPAFDNKVVGMTYGQWVSKAVLEGDSDSVLVFDDGNIAGFFSLRLPPEHEAKYGLNIGRPLLIAVDQEYHGRGVYRRLAMAAAKWFRDRGVKMVEAKFHLSNHAAINF